MIARHESFPEYLQSIIESKYNCLPIDLKNILPKYQHRHHISVLYLPAIMAYDNFNGHGFADSADKIFQIKKLIAFDTDWFYRVFDMVQAYLEHRK